jgi:hypothetical protein
MSLEVKNNNNNNPCCCLVNPHGPGDEWGIFGGIGLPCIIMLLLLKVV